VVQRGAAVRAFEIRSAHPGLPHWLFMTRGSAPVRSRTLFWRVSWIALSIPTSAGATIERAITVSHSRSWAWLLIACNDHVQSPRSLRSEATLSFNHQVGCDVLSPVAGCHCESVHGSSPAVPPHDHGPDDTLTISRHDQSSGVVGNRGGEAGRIVSWCGLGGCDSPWVEDAR
jgi:hypothetical protein